MHDNSRQEAQKIAAENVFKLLCPSESIKQKHQQGNLLNPGDTPSVVAALTILNYSKPWWTFFFFICIVAAKDGVSVSSLPANYFSWFVNLLLIMKFVIKAFKPSLGQG